MTSGAWLEWWNFVFLLPLVSGLVLALGVAVVGADFGGGDEGGDGSGGSAGEDLSGGGEGGKGVLGFLSFFGFGRGLPLSVLLPVLLVSWGVGGLLLNGLLSAFLPPLVFAPLSAVLGFGLAAALGRTLAGGAARLFGGGETATRAGGLVGCEGAAVFTVGPDGGTAHVRDPFGNIHRVACRVPPGEAAIPPGDALVVSGYSPLDGVYDVLPQRPNPRPEPRPEPGPEAGAFPNPPFPNSPLPKSPTHPLGAAGRPAARPKGD